MKKFLSVLLTVAMLVGMVVPAMTASAAGEAVAITVPSETKITYGGTSFSSKLSLADNTGDLCWLSLVVWWDASADVDDVSLTLLADGLDAGNSATGTIYAGNNKNIKNQLASYNANTAAYKGCLVDIAVVADEDSGEYTSPIDSVCDLVTLDFTMAEGIAADTTFTYNVAITSATDSADEDLDFNDEAVAVTETFIADPQFVALQEEYAEQGLTFALTKGEFDETTKQTDLKVFALNNTVGFNSVTFVLAYSPAVKINEVVDGSLFTTPDSEFNFNFDVTDTIAVGQASYAFDCFDYTYEGSTDNFSILYYMEEADNDGDSLGDNVIGDGFLFSILFEETDSAVAGREYPVLLMADTDGGIVDFDGVKISEFTLVDGSLKVPGELSCQHEETKEVVTKEPSCEETGLKNIVCVACEEVLERDVVVNALGHDYEDIAENPATCTEDGNTAGRQCKRCDKYDPEPEVIGKLGHDEGTWFVTQEATVDEEGSKELRCNRCQTVLATEVIPVLPVVHFALEDVEAVENCAIAVPVKVSANPGIFATKVVLNIGDLEVESFTDGLFAITEDNYTVNNGVLTVFVDAAELADVTGDDALFTVNFVPTRVTGDHTVTLEVVEVINAEGDEVLFAVDSGATVTVKTCEHVYVRNVVTEPTVDAEGLATLVCSICGYEAPDEIIPKLVSLKLVGADSSVDVETPVAVELVNNSGLWSFSAEFAFDASVLELVGIESGLFEVSEDNYTVEDGVVKVFVDNTSLADVTEDGTAFSLVFVPVAEGSSDVTATVVAANTINAAGKLVTVVPDEVATVTVGAYVPVEKQFVKSTAAKTGVKSIDLVNGEVTVKPAYGAESVQFVLVYADAEARYEVADVEGCTFAYDGKGYSVFNADLDSTGYITLTADNGDYQTVILVVEPAPVLEPAVLVNKASVKSGATNATYAEGVVNVQTAYGSDAVTFALGFVNPDLVYKFEDFVNCTKVAAGKGYIVLSAEAGADASFKVVDVETLAYEVVTIDVAELVEDVLATRAAAKEGATSAVYANGAVEVATAYGAESVTFAIAFVDDSVFYTFEDVVDCTVVSKGKGFVVLSAEAGAAASIKVIDKVALKYEVIAINVAATPVPQSSVLVNKASVKSGATSAVYSEGVVSVETAYGSDTVTFALGFANPDLVYKFEDVEGCTVVSAGKGFVILSAEAGANASIKVVDSVTLTYEELTINVAAAPEAPAIIKEIKSYANTASAVVEGSVIKVVGKPGTGALNFTLVIDNTLGRLDKTACTGVTFGSCGSTFAAVVLSRDAVDPALTFITASGPVVYTIEFAE